MSNADDFDPMILTLEVVLPDEATPENESPEAALETTEPEAIPDLETMEPSVLIAKPLPMIWQAVHESAVGLAHRRATPPLPCQDASASMTQPRLGLFVADGAGSAALSEVGSQTAVTALRRLCLSLDDTLTGLLDSKDEPDESDCHRFALRCVWHVLGSLEDQAQVLRRPLADLRCTLLMLLAGKNRLFWLQVGDGALVIEQDQQLSVLGRGHKGEFANQTCFIDANLTPDQVNWGLVDATRVSGLAAMSDGAAERLVSYDGQRVAGQLGDFLNQLRKGHLKASALTEFFYDAQAWRGTSGDDKTLALAAR